MHTFFHHFTHSYHDRHQATHYPLYYGEQQDQGRESGYWTVPGSRTEGALQEYTTWMDPELSAPTSSHFPFILERHTQQHQELGEYHPREARDREWTAAQRTAKEYERGFLRDGWQRRWETCSPARYNREVSTKRSDSSYRELEAWAARYSHSLPRRRRLEAELRGASQGLLESSRAPERDRRIGTDPRVAALQQLRQSANIRESGVWDTGDRLQTPTYYPSQAPAPDTSHMPDIKEKTGYQRRMFSQPPGYIAPPPYTSQHKSTPVMHHCDTSWEQEGKRQTYWSQPKLRKDVSVELQYDRKVEKEEFTKPDESKTCAELDGVKYTRQETDALQAVSPISVQNTTMHDESTLSQSQTIKAVQNTNEQTSSKIIEGRKFRLNKKTGGMTIFCLVSRIAGVTETPSLPLCISQTDIQNVALGEVSKGLQDSKDNKKNLADEVDFRVPHLTEQPNTSDVTNVKAKQEETQTYTESEMLGDNLSNKEETGNVSPEKNNITDVNSTFGKESKQPVSVKYPLWKEPSCTSRAETGSSSTFCLKVHSEDGESDGPLNQECAKVHPIDGEERRLDINKDTESEDSEGLLVIDTTCVVVKMELIPSPKKEHVHYLGCTAETEHSALDIQSTGSPSSNNQVTTTDQNTERKSLQINDKPVTDPHSDPTEKRAPNNESDISSSCMPTPSVSETLEERAQRILGIPLYDCVTEQQPGDATSFLDLCVEEQDEEVEPSPINLPDAVRQIPEETTEEEQSQNHLEVGQTEDAMCLKDSDDAKDQVTNEDSGDFAGSQEQSCDMSEENDIDLQPETELKMLQEAKITEDDQFESTSEDGKTEQSLEENQLVENHSSSQHFSSPEDLSTSSMLSHSDLLALSYMSESNTEEGLDPELATLDTAENLAPHPETSPFPHTPLEQLPSPLPPGSTESSPASTPHTDHSPSPPPPPPPPHLIDQTLEATPVITLCTKNQDEPSQLVENEFNSTLEDLAKDMTAELMSEQQSGNDQPDDPACVEESDATAEQQTKAADPRHLLEQILEISKENATDVNIMQLQLKSVKANDDACVKQSYMTEEQIQREVKNPADFSEMKTHQDNVIDSQSQREEHFDNEEEEDASCVKESYGTEEQSQTDVGEDAAGLSEQKIFQANTTDCHTQTEIEILQDTESQTEPSGLDYEESQSPLDVLSRSELPSPPCMSHKSETDPVSLLEMESVCPSPLNLDTADSAVPQTVPPLDLDCNEEFSSSFPSDSPSNLALSCPPPSQEGGESVSLDLPQKDELQYPMSLWDAVNRIRKHTAPDSENEEEEVSELWDPESLVEDLGCPDVVEDRNSRKMVFDEAKQQEVSTEGSVEDVEVGQIQQDACHEEPRGHAEEDTLSCSSTSSHSSGDTVIVAEEDEVQGTTLDAETESKTETDEEFHTSEGERRCSGELTDETAGEEDEGEQQSERDINVFCVSEECTAEVENITDETVEMTETEQKENEKDIFTPLEVAVVSDEVTG